MKVDNVKSQMRKGMLEYCILLLLHREPSYASDIILKLKEAKLIVVEGTLYPLLTRLSTSGWNLHRDHRVSIIGLLLRERIFWLNWKLLGTSFPIP